LYSFLSRRTDSTFNKVILRRLNQSRLNRYPLSLSRIAKNLKGRKDTPVIAVVGTVTNDNRLLTIPQGLKITALKFT
jgi:large subunit ribosomal protein L18e